jgi:DNA-binding CsgD family transcriptional regulator/PAS domain-containing protein
MSNVTSMMRNFQNPHVPPGTTQDGRLNQLVADIYGTALDSVQWGKVLARVVEFVGGMAGGILSNHPAGHLAEKRYRVGMDCEFSRLYAESYRKLDPVAKLTGYELEEIVSIPDLVPYDEFRRGRFYCEWARPQGWIDAANALLDKSSDGCIYFSVIRGETEGMVDQEMRRRMQLIVPHIRRAFGIHREMSRKEAEAATFSTILDGLTAALFFIDAAGKVVHSNAAGRRLAEKGELLRLLDGRLIFRDPDAERRLRESLVTQRGGSVPEYASCALPVPSSGSNHYVAHLLPLSANVRRPGNTPSAVIAVFVRRAALQMPFSSEVMKEIYGLTPAELRVLLSIVEHGGISQVAVALGIAETTVKTHLRRIFEKTGTSRQADLIRLVAGFASPLAT